MLPTIRRGDNGVYVMVAQCLTGYEPADGEFTAYFETHVKDWQDKHSLTADGVIGKGTWTKIAETAPTVSTKTLRYGCYAKAVQLLVYVHPDGIFGSGTKEAVEAFQKEHGLTADGIVGHKTWMMLITGEAEQSGDCPNVQPPNFKQYDSRWGSKMYSNHGDKSQTMKSSACGPTSMADIVAEWWDVNVTPYDLAKLSMDWGTRTYSSGTSSTFFKRVAERYKAAKYQTTSSLDTARKCLSEGGYVIVCFGTGKSGSAGYKKWTKQGHYCCIWGFKGDTYYINDPASSSSSRAKGTKAEILNCRKGFYCFWK